MTGSNSEMDFESRMRMINRRCDANYDNCTASWIENTSYISSILKNADIVEIGCGPNCGLADAVLEYGAKSYLGIDIDKTFIEQSRRINPSANFIHDDPVYVLNNLDRPVTCISSGVIDSSILRDPLYARDLIKAISLATSIGGFSIHQAFMIRKDYGPLFERYGFKSLERGRYQDIGQKFGMKFDYCFEAYVRIR